MTKPDTCYECGREIWTGEDEIADLRADVAKWQKLAGEHFHEDNGREREVAKLRADVFRLRGVVEFLRKQLKTLGTLANPVLAEQIKETLAATEPKP